MVITQVNFITFNYELCYGKRVMLGAGYAYAQGYFTFI